MLYYNLNVNVILIVGLCQGRTLHTVPIETLCSKVFCS